MRRTVVVAGGTGFLGKPLTSALAASDGTDVVVLTRGNDSRSNQAGVRSVAWSPNGDSGPWESVIDGAAAIINLAGESIAAKRWTDDQKHKILDSRLRATRSLVAAIQNAKSPPPVFVSGSAVGYYGPCGDEIITEESPAGADFLASVCQQWEAAALPAATTRTRVVRMRTGLVLERDGGALPEMLPPFRFGAGGPVGSGKQYWPWIHRADWIGIVLWAASAPDASGAINATAPAPVTNAEFARALGKAMHRPAFMPAPGFALRLLLGEMADGLLLSGQRAVPQRAERERYAFKYSRVDAALGAIFRS